MSTNGDYRKFLESKQQKTTMHGFEPLWIPECSFDFQAYLCDWSIRKGRDALLADCGLGKSLMELVWAENMVRHTNRPVLILTPLAVSYQMHNEGEKFGIECTRVNGGESLRPGVYVTNYERLHHFDSDDFAALVGDEGSILKNADGATRAAVTEFMRHMEFRLIGTATAAPNDYFELGTLSEALGYLGYADMLTRFFKEETKKDYLGWGRKTYRFRGHAEQPFWRWVCSWARACRKPSDMGFEDGEFILPELREREVVIECHTPRDGMLFTLPARDLREQRQERRQTITERCEAAAEATRNNGASVVWCHLNDEADMLEEMIPDAVQVSGSMAVEKKEERLLGFQSGEINTLILKPRIGAFGLNWQHCHNVVTFPSHSWEQYYQAVRRCWRFGQKHPVDVTIITTEGEVGVLANLRRKALAAERMFSSLVEHMNNAEHIDRGTDFPIDERLPEWLLSSSA